MRNILATAFLLSTAFIGTSSAASLHSSYQLVAPSEVDAPLSYATEEGDVVIYLNRAGGLFSPGKNDARENTTSLLDEARYMPSFAGNDSDWNEIFDCVESQFDGFRVRVTDNDPGQVAHYEAVVSGMPGDLDQPDHIGGLSPFRLDCGVISNSVVFVFADLYEGNNERLCEVIAQEVAHSFGLDHQMNCDDPMSYLGGCGDKRFRNEDAKCGEYEERECACGQATQNSKRLLAKHLGDTIAPSLDIAFPANDAVVSSSFCVDAVASDNIAVERIELYADGKLVSSQANAPFVFKLDDLELGPHALEVRAYDSENVVSRVVNVSVDANADSVECTSVQLLGNAPRGGLADVEAGCRAAGGTTGMAGWLLVPLALCFRRRRRTP